MSEVTAQKLAEPSATKIIEDAVGEMYRGFYRLRGAGLYQEEYDSMGALLNMLQRDRQTLREKYKVE